jgi:hypothetical protein
MRKHRQREVVVRGRLGVAGAVGVLTIGVLAVGVAGPASAVGDADTLASAPTGVIAQDGTVTLSGTYTCSSSSGLGTFVDAALVSGSSSSSIGNSVPAVCDGQEHSWSAQGKPYQAAKAGPATVELSLVHLSPQGFSLIPEIDVLANQRQDITLVSGSA